MKLDFLLIEPDQNQREQYKECFDYFKLPCLCLDHWDADFVKLQSNSFNVVLINPKTAGFDLEHLTIRPASSPLLLVQLDNNPTPPPPWSESLPRPADLLEFQSCIDSLESKLNQLTTGSIPLHWQGDCLNRELIQTRLEIDPQLVTSMIKIFRIEGPLAINQLEKDLLASEVEKVQRCLHKIKGMFLNVGAQRMSEVCSLLEQLPSSPASSQHILWFNALKASFELTTEQFEVLYSQLK